MDKTKAIILAAVAARSNMGHATDVRGIRRLRFAGMRPVEGLDDAVLPYCADLIENKEHEDIFMEEAQGWLDQFLPLSEMEFSEQWPRFVSFWQQSEPRRFRNALAIAEGASNPAGVSRSLNEACLECHDCGVGAANDPAVRLIVHQLAHICNVAEFNESLTAYRAALDTCSNAVEQKEPAT